jgi:hypothetical protein
MCVCVCVSITFTTARREWNSHDDRKTYTAARVLDTARSAGASAAPCTDPAPRRTSDAETGRADALSLVDGFDDGRAPRAQFPRRAPANYASL